MVAFIYDTVVGGIDGFVGEAESGLDRGHINAAEAARLKFNVDTRHLSVRLVDFAGGLANLVVTYADLAKRPVTLT
jgi:hypothetical protein